jgi:hypothetical protein
MQVLVGSRKLADQISNEQPELSKRTSQIKVFEGAMYVSCFCLTCPLNMVAQRTQRSSDLDTENV